MRSTFRRLWWWLPLAGLVSACSCNPLHVSSPKWEDQVIYFVMTDRFANGDATNDDQGQGDFDPADGARYSGGDLQGIIDQLDYIQGLGATAVWITPPVANMWWDPLQQYGGYHGYWARDLKKVDEHLGTLETYQELSRELHRRGMYLIQDVVPNHMGNFFQYSAYDASDPAAGYLPNTGAVPASKPEQAPFDQNDPRDAAQRDAAIYHWTPAISDYLDPDQELNYQLSDLDDLNTENEQVRAALRDSYGYWIREVGVDAFRVDTTKFAPHAFWNDFFHSTDPAAPGMHQVAKETGREDFFAFGEVYETSDEYSDTAEQKVASFLGTAAAPELPSVLGFPLYKEVERVFANGRPTANLTYRLGRMMDASLFPNPHRIPNFVDNHDVRRFLSASSPSALAQALAFLFTAPGIPVVYYGTEQQFTENRAAMFAGGFQSGGTDHFDTAAPFYTRIQALAELRKAHPALRSGELEVLYDNAAGSGAFVFRRKGGGESLLVVMNTSEEKALLNDLGTGLPAGTVLEVLHSEKAPPAPKVGEGGKVLLALPARAVIIAQETSETQAPPTPGATITVSTAIEGQTFTGDVTITGTVSPANTALKMVVDGYLDRAADVTVGGDGSWSVNLPVSLFPTGEQAHTVAFYAPAASAATPRFHFTSNVVFDGQTYAFSDPVGDDTGPAGTYTYPTDLTFRNQMDLTGVTLEVGATTMNVKVTMADFSRSWNPPNGFDHVCFNLYLSLPGQTVSTNVMPKLNATTPAGFTWSHSQFAFGWETRATTAVGATADTYGATATWTPVVQANASANTVMFTFDRTALGLASWSGTRLYLATWDYDGIGARFRPLSPAGGQWEMGGGAATDPMIMDDLPVMEIP